ncbi:MAG: hypothetical protein GXO09_04195 [Crenarchaeota archaeon]|nr:hypothetical protein [Thermoproteota archaeon]
MAKKKSPVSGTKKELVIITRPAITLEEIKTDKRKRLLLAVLDLLNELRGVYERTLAHLFYWLKQEGIDLGYNFIMVGDTPTSRDLHEDVMALLYTGLAESDIRTKKIRITSEGKEFLEKHPADPDTLNRVKEAIEKLKPKIMALNAQLELTNMLMKPGAPRRPRIRIGR